MVERAEEDIDIINTISDDRIQPAKNKPSDEEEYRALISNLLYAKNIHFLTHNLFLYI